MSDVYDLAIIGSGFTGLSAGVQATRMGMKTVLIEQMIMGGQILNTDLVENYPGFPKGVSGMDLITGAEEQASSAGLEYGFGMVTGIDTSKQPIEVLGDGESWLAKTVIIAAGAEHRKLGVPGEAELEGRGVSHCATCDGMFFQDQAVAVIGGGDSAMDEGLYLTNMCSKVYLIVRGEELTGLKVLQDRVAENPKIEVLYDTVVDAINGDDSVKSLTLRDMKTEEKRELEVSGIFAYIGSEPATAPFAASIPTDGGGHVKVDLRMATEIPGVFAAGECRWQSTRQLANSAGDGVTAAIAAFEWLQANA